MPQYQKFTHLEHILARPDTYVGSLTSDTSTQWVLNEEKNGMVQREISHVPGLYKIFDEILVNAIDQCVMDSTVDSIKVEIDKDSGSISVMNTGKGITLQTHENEGVIVPEMIFGQLLTSSNYDDTEKKTVGGRNGYGAKLTNVFSKSFEVDIVDVESQQRCKISWSNNMTEKSKAKITSKKCQKGYVKFTFIPDYARFHMSGLDDDTIALFEKRTYDVCACTHSGIGVYYNGTKLQYKTFEKYIDLYIGNKKDQLRVYESGDRCDVCISHSIDTNTLIGYC